MASFLDILEEPSEIMNVPAKMRPFLARRSGAGEPTATWGELAYGFSEAFRELLQVAILAAPRRDYLHMPVAHLARHSVELALKEAIIDAAVWTDIDADTDGHELLRLWEHLKEQIRACGYPIDDGWTTYCGKLVKHFDDIDRGGMRFRYPSDLQGQSFSYTRVELEGLGRAHNHIYSYCGAVISMIDAARPY